jgi:hypothetical protein
MVTILRRRAGLALVFAVFMLTATPRARAEVIKSTGSDSGTFVSTNFDFDHADESTPALTARAAGADCAFGKFTFDDLLELVPDGHTCTPPGGVAGMGTEFALVGENGVERFKNGDLLFFKATSFTQCIDFSTLPTPPFPLSFTVHFSITGGTGELAGATGTSTRTGTGAILSVDASGRRLFGWFKLKYTQTLTVPKD